MILSADYADDADERKREKTVSVRNCTFSYRIQEKTEGNRSICVIRVICVICG